MFIYSFVCFIGQQELKTDFATTTNNYMLLLRAATINCGQTRQPQWRPHTGILPPQLLLYFIKSRLDSIFVGLTSHCSPDFFTLMFLMRLDGTYFQLWVHLTVTKQGTKFPFTYWIFNNLPIHSRYVPCWTVFAKTTWLQLHSNVCAEQETRESSNTNLYAIYYVHELKSK